MKIPTLSFFSALAVLFLISIVSSCSRQEPLTGSWQGNPTRLAVTGADDATSTVTLDFAPATPGGKNGAVTISAIITCEQAVNTTMDNTFEQPYQVSVSATASITGQYADKDDDDHELVITFDPASLRVNVDPDGVIYSNNIANNVPSASLDSMTAAAADRWRIAITSAIRDEFNKYSSIDDIEIHHGDIMSAEISDRDFSFRKITPM